MTADGLVQLGEFLFAAAVAAGFLGILTDTYRDVFIGIIVLLLVYTLVQMWGINPLLAALILFLAAVIKAIPDLIAVLDDSDGDALAMVAKHVDSLIADADPQESPQEESTSIRDAVKNVVNKILF